MSSGRWGTVNVVYAFRWLVIIGGLLIASCGPSGSGGDPDLGASLDGSDDGDACVGAICTGGCDTDRDCPHAGDRCDAVSHTCAACLADSDCRAGQLCGADHRCASGCSAQKGCAAEGGVCELDAGLCVECRDDRDCRGDTPRCDPAHHRCEPCSAATDDGGGGDNCSRGSYCAMLEGKHFCLTGCKNDGDCPGVVVDDGGVGGLIRCHLARHECVPCLVDNDCAAGKLCNNFQCVDGCTAQHACPPSLSCCDARCVDEVRDPANCGRCGNPCAAGSNCCASACSDPALDVANCGGCGVVCTAVDGAPGCGAGACNIASCNAGHADCDKAYLDGCEIDTTADVRHCGACGNACSTTNATPSCVHARCVLACAGGYADCDKDVGTGCEINLQVGLANCGACGAVCAPANAVPSCVGGACLVGACDPGYADCNGDPKDGCEINLTVDVLHCGACLTVCSTNNGVPACVAGGCLIACAPGFGDCNGDVRDGCEVNPTNDVVNCGTCAAACSTQHVSATCVAGSCEAGVCGAGYSDCNGDKRGDGCEVHTDVDAGNCGGCGTVCSTNHVATVVCDKGSCSSGTCALGYADCDGNKQTNGCETHVDTDVLNCGGCGALCSTNNVAAACAGGSCQAGSCAPGYLDCNGDLRRDGCEIHADADVLHCGSCAIACSTNHIARACAGGSCAAGLCDTDYADCNRDKTLDGCEINLAADPTNCGGCGAACSTNHVATACSGGSCESGVCATGFTDCNGDRRRDGCETHTDVDLGNCGGCGVVCSTNHVTPACAGGSCASGACAAGFNDCDNNKQTNGCETHTDVDVRNCGACSRACSTNNVSAACAGGSCATGTCTVGFTDCDNDKQTNGCEVHTDADTANCGGCGVACSTNHVRPSCSKGSCAGGLCDLGYSDCDADKQTNGCETFIEGDTSNCGGCRTACSTNHVTARCAGGSCESGACAAGFTDCNGDKRRDGCEVNTDGDVSNCGGCGSACSTSHVTAACVAASCAGPCAAGYADCDANKQSNGCETHAAIDPSNCGGCGVQCSTNHVTVACSGGSCGAGRCLGNYADCNLDKQRDGCEINLDTDTGNCGGCGAACSKNHVNASCAGGSCEAAACVAGYGDCNRDKRSDGCEINLDTDLANCGTCGNTCGPVANAATTTCASGACALTCNADFYDADGLYNNGCECGAPNAGPTCAAPEVEATPFGGTTQVTGKLPPGSAGAHWYSVSFNAQVNGVSYHPRVTLSAGSNYHFDVYADCGGTLLSCADGGTSMSLQDWEVVQTAGDPTTDNGLGMSPFSWSTPSPGTVVYVRVSPNANHTGCDGYTLNMTNR